MRCLDPSLTEGIAAAIRLNADDAYEAMMRMMADADHR